jgi:hypothetical protein
MSLIVRMSQRERWAGGASATAAAPGPYWPSRTPLLPLLTNFREAAFDWAPRRVRLTETAEQTVCGLFASHMSRALLDFSPCV